MKNWFFPPALNRRIVWADCSGRCRCIQHFVEKEMGWCEREMSTFYRHLEITYIFYREINQSVAEFEKNGCASSRYRNRLSLLFSVVRYTKPSSFLDRTSMNMVYKLNRVYREDTEEWRRVTIFFIKAMFGNFHSQKYNSNANHFSE